MCKKRFLLAALVILTGGMLTTGWLAHGQPINASSINATVGPPDATASGNLADGTTRVILPVQGYAGAGGTISGSYNASVDFFVSTDNQVTWQRASVWYTSNTSSYSRVMDSTGSSSVGTFQFLNLAGVSHVSVQLASYVSGTCAVTLRTTGVGNSILPCIMSDGNTGQATPNGLCLAGAGSSSGGLLQGRAFRCPDVWKSASATASGNTGVWTPSGSKKFRLLKYRIQVTGNAATSGGGVITVAFQDNTTDMGMSHSFFCPSAAGTTLAGLDTGWTDIGPTGYLSTTGSNVLNVNLSAALTAGNVRVIACGTEE